MLRVALFSDVHGNYFALKAVLDKIEQLSREAPIDQIYCLGDILFGHAGGDAVVELLDRYNTHLICGNHDQFEIPYGRISTAQSDLIDATQEWLRQHVSPSVLTRLNDLPLTDDITLEDGRKMSLFHSNPTDLWDMVNGSDPDNETLMRVFGEVDAEVIAYGHYHQAHVMTFNGKLLINVASVDSMMSGEKDGLARFVLLTSHLDRLILQPYVVSYDLYAQNLMNRDAMAPIFLELADDPILRR